MTDDNFSEVSWNALSETDQVLFSVLTNSERTDMKRVPNVSFGKISTIVEEEDEPRITEVVTQNNSRGRETSLDF